MTIMSMSVVFYGRSGQELSSNPVVSFWETISADQSVNGAGIIRWRYRHHRLPGRRVRLRGGRAVSGSGPSPTRPALPPMPTLFDGMFGSLGRPGPLRSYLCQGDGTSVWAGGLRHRTAWS